MNEYDDFIEAWTMDGMTLAGEELLPFGLETKPDKPIAQKWMQKFWLSKAEFRLKWEPTLKKIFINIADPMFKVEGKYTRFFAKEAFPPDYEVIPLIDNMVMPEEYFEYITRLCKTTGDETFAIIEESLLKKRRI